ncbi:MAG: DUF4136 domain-containing protein [Ignavibacteria bacterium]|nr:DUF4136 domain-containing protein [Ignavibacteria bacterium]MBT8381772.1 DUF4136 domain-containing protein [Ignavibacteria bacterium]MBT8392462.1 DUF4136 domain-containing protein [Ignavibacteria bacterium]NNJ53505.1 DUF4136 domain-containing protein [Ignavibacteriaceae bacterium]NNL19907.1 DUF4136 domain-containing protein [Ignavibacteriaceae bacterium]
MKIQNYLLVLFLLYALVACSSINVVTDYDPTQDFSKYKTYRWARVKEVNTKDVLNKNSFLRKRVQAAVDTVLYQKGFEKLREGDPDFVIFIHAGVQPRMNVYHHGPYYYSPWWGPYGGYTSVSYYEQGTLVIDIVDNKEKELSWRGLGSGTVKRFSDPEALQEEINYTVGKILEDFPPNKN